MRAVRKMSITFGMVNVGCRVFTAVEDSRSGFHLYHHTCGGAVKQPRSCEKCGEKLSGGDIVSGTEVDGKIVVVTDEEKKELEDEQNGIEVLEFVPAGQIDPILLDSPYYLEPETDASAKGYGMLRQTLAETERTAIVQFTIKTRTRIGVLRIANADANVLMVQALRWPEEIRSTAALKVDKVVDVSEKELAMSRTLVDAYTVDEFDASKYTDRYAQRLAELVASKAGGATFTPSKPAEAVEDVSDLMALMEASIKQKKAA